MSNGFYTWGLGEYDGPSPTLIPNPDLGYGLNPSWPAIKIVFNNVLYFIYANAAGQVQLAYLDNRTLPINLLNFTGQLQDNNTLPVWQTATEQNSNHFTIQRSKDGVTFSDISEVKASGSSTAVKSYNYTDHGVVKLGASKLFYRLQEVDNDGKKQFSNIVSINIPGSNGKIVAYPNPVKNRLYFDLPHQLSQNALIMLYDVNGRKVLQQKPQSNNLHQQINVNNLPQGSYNLQVMDNGKKIFYSKVLILH